MVKYQRSADIKVYLKTLDFKKYFPGIKYLFGLHFAALKGIVE